MTSARPNGEDYSLGGLFDGFDAYRTVPEAATQAAVKHGFVVIDTNVLLNLYRYDDAAREGLFKVLEALGERLFVPHQVLMEFWRNRENVLRDRLTTAQATVGRLQEIGEDARKVVREWANRLAISDQVRTAVINALSPAFEEVATAVEGSAGDAEDADVRDTSQDPVLARLERILAGKVGPPLSKDDHVAALQEGRRRADASIPPGFKDKSKGGDKVAGDYLVWEQTLREASRRRAGTLAFVTGDTTGDDWWRREHGELRGPRLELFSEAQSRAGAELLLLRPQSLVFHAQRVLEVDIESDTVSKIERAEEVSTSQDRPGWTRGTITLLLSRLKAEGAVQGDAILAAVAGGGFVSRDRVYELGGYDPDRTLRGFTRPARRIMQDLQDAGLLANGASEPLETVYDAQFSYVHAAGFRVPQEFVEILSRPAAGSLGASRGLWEQLSAAGSLGASRGLWEQLSAAGNLGAFQGLAEQMRAAGNLGAFQGLAEQMRAAGVSFEDVEDGDDTDNEVEGGP